MNFLKDILRGAMIGVANIIPGVSGGTMMVSMGIYDKIIGSINHLFSDFRKSITTLLPYVIGMVASIIGLSFCITWFFERFPMQTAFLFIGLVFGGLPIIFKKVRGKRVNVGGGVLFLIFFALVVVLQIFGGDHGVVRDMEPSVGLALIMLLMGAITSASMIIPGVSGSMILMALGYYSPVVGQISSFIKALLAFDIHSMLNGAAILIPFGIGVIVGILLIARLIEYLLKKHETHTYYSILGLVMASPVAVLIGIGVGTLSVGAVLVSVLTFAVGFVAALYLSK